MAFIEHDFQNGLTVKNSTLVADYQKFYQNVYPGNGPLSGAVNPCRHRVQPRGLQSTRPNRDNAINQTDFVYKISQRPGISYDCLRNGVWPPGQGSIYRNTGIFPNGTNTTGGAIPFNPTYFGPVTFIHHSTGVNADGVTTADSNSKYLLYTQSAYARDTIEITRYFS